MFVKNTSTRGQTSTPPFLTAVGRLILTLFLPNVLYEFSVLLSPGMMKSRHWARVPSVTSGVAQVSLLAQRAIKEVQAFGPQLPPGSNGDINKLLYYSWVGQQGSQDKKRTNQTLFQIMEIHPVSMFNGLRHMDNNLTVSGKTNQQWSRTVNVRLYCCFCSFINRNVQKWRSFGQIWGLWQVQGSLLYWPCFFFLHKKQPKTTLDFRRKGQVSLFFQLDKLNQNENWNENCQIKKTWSVHDYWEVTF